MFEKEKVNILLVDDQPGKLLTYEAILQELDENLIKANSAREAFDQLLRNDFAVVLVDVCMPELDGYELASMLRDHPRFEKTPIIFISAIYLSEIDRLRGYESGAVDYVPVPVVPEILRAKLKVFVELYRKNRELAWLNRELEARVASRTAELLASNERLKQSEERHRLASEAAQFGTYESSFRTGRIHCSPQMKYLLGCEIEGDLDFDEFISLVYPADQAAVRRCMLAAQRDEDDRHRMEFRVQRQDGSIRWLLDCGQAFFEDGGAGQPSRVMGTVLDVSERKQVEERQLLLMAELDHRVKNILANVGAIAKLSSRRTASVEEFVNALDARIRAVAKAHSMLRRDTWDGISLHSYVRELLTPFIQTHGKNISIEGDSVYLLPRAAQSLALVVHELATNAVKYGSLSLPEGKVHIAWSRIPEKNGAHIKFSWRETDGPPVEKPAGQGFGVTVIKAAASELGAELDYDFTSKGVVLSMAGPIEQVTKSARRPVPADLPPLTSSIDDGGSRKCRILIVEDEAVVALQVKTDLETAGHKVVGLATNVAQGIELAANSDFDVAFLDIRLGDDLSTPVAENLLKRGIPFAFGSGFEDDGILPPHLRSIPRLAKPYKTESISRLLGSLAK
jgi:PAS domain S-box-containing protein